MPVEDALEVLVEVLDSQRAQLVEDTSYFLAHIVVGSLSPVSSYQPPLLERANRSQQRCVVVLVSQQVAYVGGQVALVHDDQLASFSTVIGVSRSKFGSQRYPHRGHYSEQMQLPPVHPPMPAT